MVRDHRPSGEVAVPFLCVHATRDEAGRVLGLAGLVSETPYWVNRALEVLDVVANWVVRLLFGLTLGLGLYATFHHGWFKSGLDLTDEGLEGVLVSGLVTIAALAGRIALRAVHVPIEAAKLALPAGLRRLAFGSTGLTSYWLARFWTEPRPFGVRALTLKPYAMRVPFFAFRRRLLHSAIYTDTAVLDDMLAWLLSRSPSAASAPAVK